jgi:hypothetical protein
MLSAGKLLARIKLNPVHFHIQIILITRLSINLYFHVLYVALGI